MARWVGLPFAAPLPDRAVSCIVSGLGSFDNTVSGFVVDEWAESVPDHAPATGGHYTGRVTTGIAVNAPTPNAQAPQAVLVAVSPDGGDWTSQRLFALLEETLALAQLRGVSWPSIPFAGTRLPAIYTNDWAMQGVPGVRWAVLDEAATAAAAVYVRRRR